MLSAALRSSGVEPVGFLPHETSRKEIKINAANALKINCLCLPPINIKKLMAGLQSGFEAVFIVLHRCDDLGVLIFYSSSVLV